MLKEAKKYSDKQRGYGITPEDLKSFVPFNELSMAHLLTAARMAYQETIAEGQRVANSHLLQSHYIYLVSGKVIIHGNKNIADEKYDALDSGQLSLGEYFPNTALIIAETDSQVILIERKQLDNMLCWDQVAKSILLGFSEDRSLDEDIEWLKKLLMSNLFHKIPPYSIRKVIDRFQPRLVQNGERIIREGERGEECYFIKEGEALVSHYNKTLNQEQDLAKLQEGSCFGEDALINMTMRNANVTMLSNGVLMVLSKRDFLSLFYEPEIEMVTKSQAEKGIADGGQWLDVRSQLEYDHQHETDAFHLPLKLMHLKSRLMDKNKRYYAYCSTGNRAKTASYLLRQQGFDVVAVKHQNNGFLSVI